MKQILFLQETLFAMHRKLYTLLFCLSVCFLLNGQTIADRITPPAGYIRQSSEAGTFATYLRTLPLLPRGRKVLLYNGQEKRNQAAAYAVVNMEIGKRDLQQCADAIIRLRAEYLWVQKRYGEIAFHFTNGFLVEYKKWAEGNRIKVEGNKTWWYASGSTDYSYTNFRKYLDMVFMYAGTASLSKELISTPYVSLAIGDIFIQGGSPGHAVIVVDVAIHPSTGKKVYLLAQSYMPAQQIHVLVNPASRSLSPWYDLSTSTENKVYTPEWVFEKTNLKRFK